VLKSTFENLSIENNILYFNSIEYLEMQNGLEEEKDIKK
jgi:hypothetical protein